MPVGFTLDELQKLQEERFRTEINVLPSKPLPPQFQKATGLKFGYRVEWAQVNGIDGYRVAVTSDNNLNAPQRMSPLIEGETTLEWTYFVGDQALARQFAVQSYKRSVNGELIFSEFRYPLVTATSKVDGGAADSAPGTSPSAPVSPTTSESSGSPGGVEPTSYPGKIVGA